METCEKQENHYNSSGPPDIPEPFAEEILLENGEL